MKSQKAYEFLIDRGYKFQEPYPHEGSCAVANYYRTDRAAEVPFCLLNEKQPQFFIQEFFIFRKDHLPMDYHSFSIAIRNQAPQGWIDFKFYSLDEKEILEKLVVYETALLEAWKVLF